MALRVDSILFDELASDPSTPADGQLWYNTTEDRLKVYRNGSIEVLLDKDEFDAHANSTSNPHQVDLEQARLQGDTLSGNINLGGNLITNSGAPSTSTDLATLQWVTDHVNSKLRGLDWQESVLDKDLSTPPGSPGTGDRYIVAAGGTGAWSSKDDQIAEWDGTQWVFAVPNEGFCTRVEDENILYIHDGVAWGSMGGAIAHASLLNLGSDDHTQYLLVAGTRAMSGNLDMGANNVTNVGTVDGVDVSAHASRHISGGADEADGDQLDIDWAGYANYTPSTAPTEVTSTVHLTAHLAGIDLAIAAAGSGGLVTKSGSVLAASFSGSPKKATVTFTSAFADANYAVTLSPVTTNNTAYGCVVESQVAGAFDINLGSASTSNLTKVNWIAVKHGESS